MLTILKHPIFSRLFAAQIIALLGTGLMTVALGLLAYQMSGNSAGVVLGTVYTIKMVAYIGLAPVASAVVSQLPRKYVLIGADLIRAAVAIALPFIAEVWHIYVLIFALQAASATFTPAFQAAIPDILTDEEDYTNALSLSRMAYDLENLLSPLIAGLLLTVVTFHWLFAGTAMGFLLSAALISAVIVPSSLSAERGESFATRVTKGSRIYLATPRLRGLWLLNLAAAAVGAFVIVNTVVVVLETFKFGQNEVALALGAFGLGSMIAALTLPMILGKQSDRTTMLAGAALLSVTAGVASLVLANPSPTSWVQYLILVGLIGFFYATILTPSGRLLRRSAHAQDRTTVFAAHFALSHVGWLMTYPLAGWTGYTLGISASLLVLSVLAALSTVVALFVWPFAKDPEIEHSHPDLPKGHPHLKAHGDAKGRHRHTFVIDSEHRVWPTQG
jgi:MFS family permease